MATDDDFARTLFGRMQGLGHIRLAHGVVGKMSVVAGIALVALGGIAWRVATDLLLVMGGMVLIVFFVYLVAVLWFAHRHPEQALLEGAEIIQYRQLEMAAHGISEAAEATRMRQHPSPPELPEDR